MTKGVILNASGDLRARADRWWAAKMGSTLDAVHVKGDGDIRFWWRDADESGSYGLPIETLYRETSTPPATPPVVPAGDREAVACSNCGWTGDESELEAVGGLRRCPECEMSAWSAMCSADRPAQPAEERAVAESRVLEAFEYARGATKLSTWTDRDRESLEKVRTFVLAQLGIEDAALSRDRAGSEG